MAVGSIPDSSNCAEKFLAERAPEERARTDRGSALITPSKLQKRPSQEAASLFVSRAAEGCRGMGRPPSLTIPTLRPHPTGSISSSSLSTIHWFIRSSTREDAAAAGPERKEPRRNVEALKAWRVMTTVPLA